MDEPAQPERVRPQTSTRDLVSLRDRLAVWIAGQLPGVADPSVSELTTPGSNGMSSETILFDATWRDGADKRREALVIRMAPDPSNFPVFPAYDLDKQFRIMRAVGELGVAPVPPVFWSEPDPDAAGIAVHRHGPDRRCGPARRHAIQLR